MKIININVSSPDELAKVLRHTADSFRESQIELSAAWGDLEAGRIWEKFATILDRSADQCERACGKYFK